MHELTEDAGSYYNMLLLIDLLQPTFVFHLSYLLLLISFSQPKDSSSQQIHGTLSRKRGHCTLRRGSSDRGRPETGQVQDWRDNAVIPLHPVRPVPSLSPSSSISSLQYSISQDSESSASTETVVKKVRRTTTGRQYFTFVGTGLLYIGT